MHIAHFKSTIKVIILKFQSRLTGVFRNCFKDYHFPYEFQGDGYMTFKITKMLYLTLLDWNDKLIFP